MKKNHYWTHTLIELIIYSSYECFLIFCVLFLVLLDRYGREIKREVTQELCGRASV